MSFKNSPNILRHSFAIPQVGSGNTDLMMMKFVNTKSFLLLTTFVIEGGICGENN